MYVERTLPVKNSFSFFKNPMISKTMKTDLLQLAAHPSQIEEAYDFIHRKLSSVHPEMAIFTDFGVGLKF